VTACELCADSDGSVPGVLTPTMYEDQEWLVGVLRGFEVPGWVTIVPRRHITFAAELSDAEAQTIGPLLRRATKAIRDTVACEKVYTVAFGELFPHWHLLLMAVPAAMREQARGPALFGARDRFRDAAGAREVAAGIAGRLG
jgi:diadenosine tetraphosphate (Ap4A) HIT family hydrolase